jgi:hypothetical protein
MMANTDEEVKKRSQKRELMDSYTIRNKEIVNDHKRKHPCVDCGEKDIDVLEFDHVRGEKKAAIGVMVQEGYSVDMLLKEISKCEIRCSNCHRKRHIMENFRKSVEGGSR